MASKRRLRRRACEGKIAHKDKEAAFAHLFDLKRQGYHGHIYKCEFCGNYHIGRETSGQRKAKEIRRGY